MPVITVPSNPSSSKVGPLSNEMSVEGFRWGGCPSLGLGSLSPWMAIPQLRLEPVTVTCATDLQQGVRAPTGHPAAPVHPGHTPNSQQWLQLPIPP